MKRLFFSLAALLLAACGKSTVVFYTVHYPVVRVEAEVTLDSGSGSDEGGEISPGDGATPTPPDDGTTPGDGTSTDGGATPDDGTEGSGTGSDSTGSPDGTGTGSDGTAEDPLVQEIRAAIVAAAPVQAGGGYTLYFSQYNGGRARIVRNPEAEPVMGLFGKEPAKSQFEVIFDGEDYICKTSFYNDGTEVRKTVLEIDLTESFQALYPTAGITRAVRREYTSTTAN